MHAAGLTAAGVLVVAAVVTLVMLRGGDRETTPAQEGARVSERDDVVARSSVSRAAPPPSWPISAYPASLAWMSNREHIQVFAQMTATLVGTVPSPAP